MNKPLVLLGSLTLACSSLGAWAQQTPPQDPPPMVGQPAAVPGTDGTITSPQAALAEQAFVAGLSGLAEVPPVQTEGSGTVALTLNEDGSGLHYRLAVDNLENVAGAHLHLGRTGENGPIVVPLLGEGAPGDAATLPQGQASGVIAEGDITAQNLTGPLAGTPLAVLLQLLRGGSIYANVHTSQNPQGAIRGQVQGLAADATAACELLTAQAGQGATGGGTSGGAATGDGTTGDTGSGTAGGGTTDDGADIPIVGAPDDDTVNGDGDLIIDDSPGDNTDGTIGQIPDGTAGDATDDTFGDVTDGTFGDTTDDTFGTVVPR